MKAKLVTAPVFEPVSVTEVKEHLRVDIHDDDELISNLVTAARERVEEITRRAIITQTWDYYLDKFPSCDRFPLPFGNLQSVTSVKYKDSDATETTMTVTTEYLVETNSDQHGAIVLPYAETWPSTTLYPSNPITVRFICGWTTAALVPGRIKQAIKMIASDLYENRGEAIIGQTYTENRTAEFLLNSWRLWGSF